jgi:hypothetical protein
LEAPRKNLLHQNKSITVAESKPRVDIVDSKVNEILPKFRTRDNRRGRKPSMSDPEGAVSKQATTPKKSGLEAISAGRLSFLLPNIDVMAGIVLLGTPGNTPLVSLEWPLKWPKGQRDKDKPPTELLLGACLNIRTFTDLNAYVDNPVYHACFENIVNEIGIPTQCYWGSSEVFPEAGRPFKVSCVLPALLPSEGTLRSQCIHFLFVRKLSQNVNRP